MKRPGWSFSTDHLDRFLSLGDLIRDYLVLKNQPAILRPAESSE